MLVTQGTTLPIGKTLPRGKSRGLTKLGGFTLVESIPMMIAVLAPRGPKGAAAGPYRAA